MWSWVKKDQRTIFPRTPASLRNYMASAHCSTSQSNESWRLQSQLVFFCGTVMHLSPAVEDAQQTITCFLLSLVWLPGTRELHCISNIKVSMMYIKWTSIIIDELANKSYTIYWIVMPRLVTVTFKESIQIKYCWVIGTVTLSLLSRKKNRIGCRNQRSVVAFLHII